MYRRGLFFAFILQVCPVPNPSLDTSRIRAISIDLDDTLWPIWPTITRAESVLLDWLTHHAPATAALFSDTEALRAIRNQMVTLRPDLKVEMLSGNIDTRLRRAAEGDFDAILLAVSGMTRLGVTEHIREKLSPDAFLPAPGQGALAIQTRAEDIEAPWVAALNHAPTAVAVAAERGAMTALEGSCRTAVGAYALIDDDTLRLTTEMLSPDGSARWRRVGELFQPTEADARALGEKLGAEVHAFAGDQEVDPASLDG